MQWQSLAGPLLDAGLNILAGAIGGPAGAVAASVGREIARELGVGTPQEVVQKIEADPAAVVTLAAYERDNADKLALFAAEQATFREILARDSAKGGFWDAWRPATMWALIVMWLWAIIALPTINATLGAGIPLPPFETLFGLTAVWSGLYMGGHTAIRLLGKGE